MTLFAPGSDLSLPGLCGPDLVPLFFVGRQSPSLELTVRAIHFAGMEPLAALGTAIDAIAFGYPIFLLTPVGHLRHRVKKAPATTGFRHPAFLSSALVNQEFLIQTAAGDLGFYQIRRKSRSGRGMARGNRPKPIYFESRANLPDL
jgi:hypothetical protein